MTYGRQPQIDKDIDWVIDEDGNVLGYMKDQATMSPLGGGSSVAVVNDFTTGGPTSPASAESVRLLNTRNTWRPFGIRKINPGFSNATSDDVPTISVRSSVSTSEISGATLVSNTGQGSHLARMAMAARSMAPRCAGQACSRRSRLFIGLRIALKSNYRFGLLSQTLNARSLSMMAWPVSSRCQLRHRAWCI